MELGRKMFSPPMLYTHAVVYISFYYLLISKHPFVSSLTEHPFLLPSLPATPFISWAWCFRVWPPRDFFSWPLVVDIWTVSDSYYPKSGCRSIFVHIPWHMYLLAMMHFNGSQVPD